ncbi:MAG TPA: hypothetical protein VIT41_15215 [Microlunatus sp.]
MHLVYEFLTLVHLIGFAALLGGCLVQFRAVEPEVSRTMLIGAWTQLTSGLALAVVLELASDPADPVNHAKLGVKLGVAAVVVLLVAKNRKFQSIPKGLWGLITALTLVNACVAVFWR